MNDCTCSQDHMIRIVAWSRQLETLEAHGLRLQDATQPDGEGSTLYVTKFNDYDVQCFTILPDGTFKIERRDFVADAGWEIDGRCYACDYLSDTLTEADHEGETVMLCSECLAE